MQLEDVHFGGGLGKIRALVITQPEAKRMVVKAFGPRAVTPQTGHEVLLPKGPDGEEPLIENISGQLRYRPDSRAFRSHHTGHLTMTSDVIEYLRSHPDFARQQCRPEELAWVETHLPPRYDNSYAWEEYVSGRRENPGPGRPADPPSAVRLEAAIRALPKAWTYPSGHANDGDEARWCNKCQRTHGRIGGDPTPCRDY